ncbi:pilin [Collimonas humicola]|uniref:pilin n=1 Tax=Collimonas humicola TaxID=2825886 RepID=UPI001B8D1E20|nr:DUF2628 domain-containing protein [Collimonas humicola]
MSRFSSFDDAGKSSPSWHWPALFVPFYWFLYRKMWRNALIYLAAPYFVTIFLLVTGAASGKSDGMFLGIGFIVLALACRLIPAIFANALYYAHCKKKIAQIKATRHSVERQLGELSGKGGTSGVFLFVLLIGIFIAVVGILAAIAIPAYQDYTTRARVAAATEFGLKVTQSVSNYYIEHKQIPTDLAQAGFVDALPRSVKEININGSNGVISVVMAIVPIAGKTLSLVPSLDAGNHITWRCMSLSINDKYLPSQCKQQK